MKKIIIAVLIVLAFPMSALAEDYEYNPPSSHKELSGWAIPVALITAAAVGFAMNHDDRALGAISGPLALVSAGVIVRICFD